MKIKKKKAKHQVKKKKLFTEAKVYESTQGDDLEY